MSAGLLTVYIGKRSTILQDITKLTWNVDKLSAGDCMGYFSARPVYVTITSIMSLRFWDHKRHVPGLRFFKCSTSVVLLCVFSELFPRSRYLYMYRDVTKTAMSYFRLVGVIPSRMLIYLFGRLSESVSARLFALSGEIHSDFHVLIENDLTIGAVFVLVSMKAYLDFRRRGFDISAIRYEDLIERPLEICRRAMEACGLPVSFADNIVSCMQEDSQKNTALSKSSLSKFCDPEVTPEIKDSLDSLAAKYGLPPVSEGCILEGTLS